MSCRKILTLNSMYAYNDKLFDGIVLPENVDHDLTVSTILDYCGSNEVRYPDMTMLTAMILDFFKIWDWKFEKLAKTLDLEYNPIENYDRYEDSKHSTTHSGQDKTENTGEVTASPNTVTEGDYYGFNLTQGSRPVDKTTVTGSDQTDTNSTSTMTHGHQEALTVDSHIHGNIGVTTSQQMIQSEKELADFSIYYTIAMQFEDAITIPVY